jgi:cytochrome c biogenesis protein CcdA
MLLLMLFALIAGAGTAITPCVLPVLPALLAASALRGRRRPLGIVIGLGATFTIAIVALAQLVRGVGLSSGAARTLAIVVLFAFGIVLLIPDLAARLEAPLPRLARGQRLHSFVSLPTPGQHELMVKIPAKVSAYDSRLASRVGLVLG